MMNFYFKGKYLKYHENKAELSFDARFKNSLLVAALHFPSVFHYVLRNRALVLAIESREL